MRLRLFAYSLFMCGVRVKTGDTSSLFLIIRTLHLGKSLVCAGAKTMLNSVMEDSKFKLERSAMYCVCMLEAVKPFLPISLHKLKNIGLHTKKNGFGEE